MPIGLCRHVRRLLPLAVRFLRPVPYAPLRPLYQRRQGNRKLFEVALTCVRFRFAVRHGAASPMQTAAVPWTTPLEVAAHCFSCSDVDLVVEIVIYINLCQIDF